MQIKDFVAAAVKFRLHCRSGLSDALIAGDQLAELASRVRDMRATDDDVIALKTFVVIEALDHLDAVTADVDPPHSSHFEIAVYALVRCLVQRYGLDPAIDAIRSAERCPERPALRLVGG